MTGSAGRLSGYLTYYGTVSLTNMTLAEKINLYLDGLWSLPSHYRCQAKQSLLLWLYMPPRAAALRRRWFVETSQCQGNNNDAKDNKTRLSLSDVSACTQLLLNTTLLPSQMTADGVVRSRCYGSCQGAGSSEIEAALPRPLGFYHTLLFATHVKVMVVFSWSRTVLM